MDNHIMALELSVYYEDNDLFCEGVGDKLYSFGAKVVAMIKKMIVHMKAFANELRVTLESASLSIKLQASMVAAKNKLAKGETVYIPDVKYITKVYGSAINDMRKEINTIGKDFNKWFTNNSDKITRHIERKENALVKLDELVESFSKDVETRLVKVEPSEIDAISRNVVNTAQKYLSEYVKLVDDLNQLTVLLEKRAALAEINFDLKSSVNDHVKVLTKIKNNATKMLRKSVFNVCFVAAGVIP